MTYIAYLFFFVFIAFPQYNEVINEILPIKNKLITINNSFNKVLHQTYQTLLSQHDPARCEFSPSCSSFAIQSLKHHGLLKGLLLSGDRLMRSGYSGNYIKKNGSFIDLVGSY